MKTAEFKVKKTVRAKIMASSSIEICAQLVECGVDRAAIIQRINDEIA